MKKYLIKSRFKTAVECPKKLFYTGKKEYRNTNNENSFLQSLADGGFQVGELAKCLYPDGIEITAKGNEEALAETAKYLQQDKVILFEPAIAFNNLLVRIDILIKNGDIFELIEVKAKSIDSTDPQIESRNGIKSGIKPYIEDVAFQAYVLKSAFPASRVTSYLLMPNKADVSHLDQMNQLFKIERDDKKIKVITNPLAKTITRTDSLLYQINIDRYIDMVHHNGIEYPGGHRSLAEVATEWAEAYENNIAIDAPIGVHCGNCEFKSPLGDELKSGFHECWKRANKWTDDDFKEATVLDLWNFRGKQSLIDRGVFKLKNIQQEDINYSEADEGLSNSERQWLQINGIPKEHDCGGYFLDKNFMEHEMASWKYPYHFIDFETSAVALPFHVGMRPYESVAFQFSHHILEEDGTLRHAGQFLLAKAGVFPNYEFARALMNELNQDEGSVFMWANHENTILSHICTQIETRADAPEDKELLSQFLKTLIKGGDRAMVDLRTVSQKGYFHPETKGSNSIKKVLPAALMSSQYLKDKYSQPIYGAKDGIESLNFQNMIWWSQDDQGKVIDPYKKLLDRDLLGSEDDDSVEIAEGGAAAMAYGRLQYEELRPETRLAVEKSLYKYCELDTLAMVMIVEAWIDLLT